MLVVMATYVVSHPCTRPLGPHFLTSHSPSSSGLSCSHLYWYCLQHVYSRRVSYASHSARLWKLFSAPSLLFCHDVVHGPRRLVLNFTQGSCVTSGDLIQNLESAHTKYLCAQLRLILHFEISVSVTTDYPVDWPQYQRP